MRARLGGGALGAWILGGLLVLAVAAPWIAPYPPDRQTLTHRLESPSRAHPLGRDALGRDVLSRLIWGARISLATGLAVIAISSTAGVAAGSLAGFAGGWLDLLVGAIIDLLLGFPGVLLAIALVSVLGPRPENVVLALCLVGWVSFARLARSQARALRPLEFVEAARCVGGTRARLLFRHVVPNLLAPVGAQAALGLGGAILAEAGLSFLGLGSPPPLPSWGSMLQEGSQNLLDAPHLALGPAAAIVLAVLGAQTLGDGLRDRLDPRSRPERIDRWVG